MIALLQRVREATVDIDGERVAQIGQGLLVLLGVEHADTEGTAQRAAERIVAYRVFSDADDKMNLSLQDIQGGLLLVPQFTLAADTKKGLRPSFHSAAAPSQGSALFDAVVGHARGLGLGAVETGSFGADMQVSLVNDGPVTFHLRF